MGKEKKKRSLSYRQQKFVDVFDGDIKKAAEIAGLSYRYCITKMVKKGAVREAIRNRQLIETGPLIMSRQQRQYMWSKMAQDETKDDMVRLRASELLGKSECDFIERIVVQKEEILTEEDCEAIRKVLSRVIDESENQEVGQKYFALPAVERNSELSPE